MNVFKKLFGKKDTEPEQPTDPAPPTDPFANAPAFKQMMDDMQKQQQAFEDIFERIVPILKQGVMNGPMTMMVDGKEVTMPIESSPVSMPAYDNLSVIFGIDRGTHYEWLQNKQIEVVKGILSNEQLLAKAYENLVISVKSQLSFNVLKENLGIFTNCSGLESSLTLIPEIWNKIQNTFKTDDIVFSVPTQDVFVFCAASSADNVNIIKNKTYQVFNNPEYKKKISPKVYRRDKNGVITVLPE